MARRCAIGNTIPRMTLALVAKLVIAATTVCQPHQCNSRGVEIDDGQSVQCCTVKRESSGMGDGGPPSQREPKWGPNDLPPPAPRPQDVMVRSQNHQRVRFRTSSKGACKDVAVLERLLDHLAGCHIELPEKSRARFTVKWPKTALGFTVSTSRPELRECVANAALTLPPPEKAIGTCTAAATFLEPR